MNATKFLTAFLLGTSAALAGLPAVGPDYVRPAVQTPTSYRDTGSPDSWKAASPSDGAARGEWWRVFGNPTLNDLESLAVIQNQDLIASAARVEQAAAAAGVARSGYLPQVAANPSATRSRLSTTTDNPFPYAVTNDFSLPVLASWELDLFGRIRRLNEGARADAQASSALFESVRLSVAANLASDFFSLRGSDRELEILSGTIALRQKELDLVSAQLRSGTATELDTARAGTELAEAQAEAAAESARRESLQDAIAVLVGQSATSFSIPPSTEDITLPVVPPGVPSDLLERRPDVAAAERQLEAANARIGVAKAAFFPSISLTGSAGFESGSTSHLFGPDSRTWGFGPSVYLPLFQGGRNRANLEASKAAYDEGVAVYRGQLLIAFKEVQESLTGMKLLADEAEAQDRAVAGAKRASSLAHIRYQAGYVSYIEVIEAQRTELQDERASAQLFALRLNTEVNLIKALGGSWTHLTD